MDDRTLEQLLFEKPIPPRKEDRLYGNGVPHDRTAAHVNVTWADPQIGYTEGYRRGASRLVDHVVETQRDRDFLAYPIIFLYRHHIELALKNLVRLLPYLLNRKPTKDESDHLNGHRLDWLWGDLKPMLVVALEAVGWANSVRSMNRASIAISIN